MQIKYVVDYDFVPINLLLSFNKTELVEYFYNTSIHGNIFWDLVTIRSTSSEVSKNSQFKIKWDFSKEWAWDSQFAFLFPELITQIEMLLPFTYITYAAMLSNYEVVLPHNDYNFYPGEEENLEFIKRNHGLLEPSMYRIIISGSIDNNFFLSDPISPGTLKSSDYNTIMVAQPEDSNVFCFPTFGITHGSLKPSTPKIILLLHGLLDPIKHVKLLRESIAKYSNFCIKL